MRSMECTGILAAKFCILLDYKETLSNELMLPTNFSLKYGSLLDESMELKVRNGYIQPVEIDKVNWRIKGVFWLFKNLELKGGELLLFEYFGHYKFNVYIIGSDGSEIRYPAIVKHLQSFFPGIVTIGDAGWRFVIDRVDKEGIIDHINPPAAFISRCGFALPQIFQYVLSNGKKFVGSYNTETCRLTGLSYMFEILGMDCMVGVSSLLFTYDGMSYILISAFDSQLDEIVFPGTPLSMDGNLNFPLLGKYFQITVGTKDMLDDCFVVEISNEFKDLCEMWESFQCINVYSGSGRWRILTRKRDNYYRTTIEDGWKKLRDGLGLNVGDTCIFECPTQSYDQFRIRVLKNED